MIRKTFAADQLAILDGSLSDWLMNSALPLWESHGHDKRRGGFFENLAGAELTTTAEFKRLRVLTRQIYVFSEAARLGFSPAKAALSDGVDFLIRYGRSPDGGYASRFSMDGEIIDGTRDLYDVAFTLFALAHAWDVLRDGRLLDRAEELFAFIDGQMSHPAGGYHEALPIPECARRQNPHMHLLEALLAWAALNGSPWIERADRIVALALERFVCRRSGALTEYFDDGLQPAAGSEGRIVEPGHQFEWVWLLTRYEALRCRQIDAIEGLYLFAWRHGVDWSTGRLHAEVLTDGEPRPAAVRLWVHTEWLKGELAMFERSGDPKFVSRAAVAYDAMAGYLEVAQPGLWRERCDPKSGFVDEPSPASSLYHVVLAASELKRISRSITTRAVDAPRLVRSQGI